MTVVKKLANAFLTIATLWFLYSVFKYLVQALQAAA